MVRVVQALGTNRRTSPTLVKAVTPQPPNDIGGFLFNWLCITLDGTLAMCYNFGKIIHFSFYVSFFLVSFVFIRPVRCCVCGSADARCAFSSIILSVRWRVLHPRTK